MKRPGKLTDAHLYFVPDELSNREEGLSTEQIRTLVDFMLRKNQHESIANPSAHHTTIEMDTPVGKGILNSIHVVVTPLTD